MSGRVSGDQSKSVKYVYDLPYRERKILCNILDMDNQWERLVPAKHHPLALQGEQSLSEIVSSQVTTSSCRELGSGPNTTHNLGITPTAVTSRSSTYSPVAADFPRPPQHLLNAACIANSLLPAKSGTSVSPRQNLLGSSFRENLDISSTGGDRGLAVCKIPAELLQTTRSCNKICNADYSSRAVVTESSDEVCVNSTPESRLLRAEGFDEEYKNRVEAKLRALDISDSTEGCCPGDCQRPLPEAPVVVSSSSGGGGSGSSGGGGSGGSGGGGFNDKVTVVAASGGGESNSQGGLAAVNNAPRAALALPSTRNVRTSLSEVSVLSDSSTAPSVPVISYAELSSATDLWSSSNLLGKGGFGSVYRGTWKNTEVAVKRIHLQEETALGTVPLQISQTLEELRHLQSYRHDNILQLYGCSADPGQPVCLVYQYMVHGSVEDRLQCRKLPGCEAGLPVTPLDWLQRLSIARGTARALQYLHTVNEKPLIHGDIKSANILLDCNFEPKLGDFGLAREGPMSQYTSMKVSRVHGTKPYIPEEYLRDKKLSTKVDCYSYGIVLFELCTGLRAYDEKRQHKFLKEFVSNCTESESLQDSKAGFDVAKVFPTLLQIGKECIVRVAKKRPEMTDVYSRLQSFTVQELRCSLGSLHSSHSSLYTPGSLAYHSTTPSNSPSPHPTSTPFPFMPPSTATFTGFQPMHQAQYQGHQVQHQGHQAQFQGHQVQHHGFQCGPQNTDALIASDATGGALHEPVFKNPHAGGSVPPLATPPQFLRSIPSGYPQNLFRPVPIIARPGGPHISYLPPVTVSPHNVAHQNCPLVPNIGCHAGELLVTPLSRCYPPFRPVLQTNAGLPDGAAPSRQPQQNTPCISVSPPSGSIARESRPQPPQLFPRNNAQTSLCPGFGTGASVLQNVSNLIKNDDTDDRTQVSSSSTPSTPRVYVNLSETLPPLLGVDEAPNASKCAFSDAQPTSSGNYLLDSESQLPFLTILGNKCDTSGDQTPLRNDLSADDSNTASSSIATLSDVSSVSAVGKASFFDD